MTCAAVVLAPFWIMGAAAASTGPFFQVHAKTGFGDLVGEHIILQNCDHFLGIPYAEPPLGELRFAAPKPWSQQFPRGGRHAIEAGARCLQPENSGGNEDCLFLNIFRRHGTDVEDELPVMVFLHGGSFVEGAGDFSFVDTAPNAYEGCPLAAVQDVIVVTLNYRLGPLGFAVFEGEEEGKVLGNFGMLDQREALNWVRRQARAFGGDPNKVTLFGESAGAMSVLYHMVAPASDGLFRAAISESGFPQASYPEIGLERTRQLAASLGCQEKAAQSRLTCLRGKRAGDLVAHEAKPGESSLSFLSWAPVVDGADMPEHPIKLFHEGKSHRVPLLAGTNTDEGNLFIWKVYTAPMNESQYEDVLTLTLFDNTSSPRPGVSKAEVQRVREAYPPTAGIDLRSVVSEMGSDKAFVCGTQLVAQAHSKHTDTYLYRFNFREGLVLPEFVRIPGVFHGIELAWVFNDPLSWGEAWGLTAEEVSLRLQSRWASFARALDPNPGASGSDAAKGRLPTWPKYDGDAGQDLVLQAPQDEVERHLHQKKCQMWEDVMYSKFYREATPEVAVEIVVV